MANYRAVANGNWSSLATWQDDGSGSYVASTVLPGAADTVRTNNFTVTCDINSTVLNVSNESATSVTAGGGFLINNGITLTATNTATCSASSGNFLRPDVGASATFICPSISTTGNFTISQVGAGRIMNIIGNTTSATSSFGTYRPDGGVINITGNINQTANGYWVDMLNGGTFNITGNLSTILQGFWVRGACTVNLTGSLTSASVTSYLNTNQNVTFTHIGPVTVGGNAAAIVDTFGIYAGTGPFINNGIWSAVAATRFQLINTSPTYLRAASSVVSTDKFLYTEDNVGGVPATANVRSGTVYGIGGGLTGTLVVPAANAVTAGVVYDNGTVGTAQNTAASFLTELAASTDPLAVRLKNVATVQTTGDQIAAAL